MVKPHINVRLTEGLKERLRVQSLCRGTVISEIVRQAIDIGLEAMEGGQIVNELRLAVAIEATQAISAMLLQELCPGRIREVDPETKLRMDKYHARV